MTVGGGKRTGGHKGEAALWGTEGRRKRRRDKTIVTAELSGGEKRDLSPESRKIQRKTDWLNCRYYYS